MPMAWKPQIEVGVELAARLIRREFPQFVAASVAPLGAGWDYTAHQVDDAWVFRFPRRAGVLPGMEREIATVPRLTLPVAVPAASFVGGPSDEYPWRFFGARF